MKQRVLAHPATGPVNIAHERWFQARHSSEYASADPNKRSNAIKSALGAALECLQAYSARVNQRGADNFPHIEPAEPFPPDLALYLGDLLLGEIAAHPDRPTKLLRHGAGKKPRGDVNWAKCVAIAYVRAANAGLIDDHSARKTVMANFGLKKTQDVGVWLKEPRFDSCEWGPEFTDSMKRFPKFALGELEAAGKIFQGKSESEKARWARDTRRTEKLTRKTANKTT